MKTSRLEDADHTRPDQFEFLVDLVHADGVLRSHVVTGSPLLSMKEAAEGLQSIADREGWTIHDVRPAGTARQRPQHSEPPHHIDLPIAPDVGRVWRMFISPTVIEQELEPQISELRLQYVEQSADATDRRAITRLYVTSRLKLSWVVLNCFWSSMPVRVRFVLFGWVAYAARQLGLLG